jgi:hypothetical protein
MVDRIGISKIVLVSDSHILVHCLAVGRLSIIQMMRFVLLWWISKLPSRVGHMCLTMPA